MDMIFNKSNIRIIGVVHNQNCAKTMDTIKSDEGAHGICNAGHFNRTTYNPNCNEIWLDGVKIAEPGFTANKGYVLGDSPVFGSRPATPANFIGGYPSFENGSYNHVPANDLLDPAVRCVLAQSDTQMIHHVSNSATFDKVRDNLVNKGFKTGIFLDGGGSAQCSYDNGEKIPPQRKVVTFLVFWFKDQAMPVRKQGAKGWVVKEIQRILNAKGASPKLDLDGSFGPATLAAVKAFQSAQGLAVDGSVGPATWAKLDA